MPETLLRECDHFLWADASSVHRQTAPFGLELGMAKNHTYDGTSSIAVDLPQRINNQSRRRPYLDSRTVWLIMLMSLCNLQGCATPKNMTGLANREATSGKSKEELLQCAGTPVREATQDEAVTFFYYREAPMLQESFPASKGSFPRPHHGCWATVLIKAGRVMDIGYRSVPDTIDSVNLCEAIFTACHPQ